MPQRTWGHVEGSAEHHTKRRETKAENASVEIARETASAGKSARLCTSTALAPIHRSVVVKSRSRRALEIAALGAIYYLTARLGLLMQLPGTTASAVWPPSGIGLAAMLLCGLDVWPGIAIGALLANLLTLPATWVGFTVAVAIATGTTLEQVVVVMLMRRLGRSVNPFERASSALWFVAAAVVACVLAATNGVMALRLSGLIDSQL